MFLKRHQQGFGLEGTKNRSSDIPSEKEGDIADRWKKPGDDSELRRSSVFSEDTFSWPCLRRARVKLSQRERPEEWKG